MPQWAQRRLELLPANNTARVDGGFGMPAWFDILAVSLLDYVRDGQHCLVALILFLW